MVKAFPLIFFVFLIVPLSSFADPPSGTLYWQTDDYPNEFFLYDDTLSYDGAVAALDYACQQYSNGTYTGNVRIDGSANNFPAKKGGWCRNSTFIGEFDGSYYTAYLYCNSEKRVDIWDDSTCESPPEILPVNPNKGPPPCLGE